MKCPKCGAGEENLDHRLDGIKIADAKNIVWTCFECNHEWKEKLKKLGGGKK